MSSDHYDDCSPADIAGHRVFLGRGIDLRPTPAAPDVDITHSDVGVRIVGAEVTPVERSLIVERVLLKERIADIERELVEARKDRASIVAFLAAEAARFTHEGQRAFRRNDDDGCQRHQAISGAGRTWSAQIARGDDRLGGGQ